MYTIVAACEALAPHRLNVALSTDPTGIAPVGSWMHRSCVPFIFYRTSAATKDWPAA